MGLARTWKERISARAFGRRGLLLALTALVVACGSQSAIATGPVPAAVPATVPSGDWPTFGYDSARSGGAPASGITAANARGLTPRSVHIDGIADSAAVELHAVKVDGRRHDLIVVDTTYGKTIAIDPATGHQLWEFRPPAVNAAPGNPQVATATPTVDPNRRYLYSASPNGVIYKLSVASGRQIWARSITFDAGHEKLASALNVSGRYVVAVTGGYIGDAPPYDAHVVTIDRVSGRIAQVWNSECSSQHRLIRARLCSVTNARGDSAIWGRAGAVIEPHSGRILVATGNGRFDGRSSWGDSVLELTPNASRLRHNWTPVNQLALSRADADVGSTSPTLLPLYHGFRLAVQGGKDGKLALLNVARLNGTAGPASGRLGGELQQISAPGSDPTVYTAPAIWSHGGQIYVYVATNSATAAYQLLGRGRPRLRLVWEKGIAGSSPVVAGGLLYIYDQMDGALVIRNPLSGAQIRSLPVPQGHWNSPIVVGGRIILPTGSYFDHRASSTIAIYHLPGR
ncbi:MAG: PQQ-binding-like beta-propeller repeat protein [Solirubrobacteraceae bacterium]